MTSDHVVYIPMILMVGGFLGFILGARAARNAYDLERRREAERLAMKAERDKKRAARAAAKAGADADDTADRD